MGKRKNGGKRLIETEECSRGYNKSYEVLEELLNNSEFVKAARESSNPSGFKRFSPKLIEISSRYDNHRISLSAANGRTYFDSAFPVSNHNGTYVKDANGIFIDISGSPDVLYANLIAYDMIYERKVKGKSGVGGNVIWDETVGEMQYFLSKTVINGRHQCDKNKFILRISNKPEIVRKSSHLGNTSEAEMFAEVGDKLLVVVGGNLKLVDSSKIIEVDGKKFALVDGKPVVVKDQNYD